MPGFNFSFNIDFGTPSTDDEEKEQLDGNAPIFPSLPSIPSMKGKFTLLASVGMTAEITIAVYFLLNVISNHPNDKKLKRFVCLQYLFLFSALPIFIASIILITHTSGWADNLTNNWDRDGHIRFVGIHGLVVSVLGVPWALCFIFVTKKAQQEIRLAARHSGAVDVPPSYEASTGASTSRVVVPEGEVPIHSSAPRLV